MADNLVDGILLQLPQSSPEFDFNRCTWAPFVPHFGPYFVGSEERECLRQASARDRDVLRKVLSARDHPRLVPG